MLSDNNNGEYCEGRSKLDGKRTELCALNYIMQQVQMHVNHKTIIRYKEALNIRFHPDRLLLWCHHEAITCGYKEMSQRNLVC